MNYKTHTISTLMATSYVTLFTSIDPSITLFLGAALGGLSPDIDEPQSYIGRKNTVKIGNKRIGLPTLIKSIFGHRGITHTILAMIVAFIPYFYLTDISSMDHASIIFNPLSQFLLGFGLGYVFHIMGDLLTVQGVPLLIPFTKKRFKTPLFAFRVNSTGETIAFIICGLLLLFSIYLHIEHFIS